jgi:hypothetical protein
VLPLRFGCRIAIRATTRTTTPSPASRPPTTRSRRRRRACWRAIRPRGGRCSVFRPRFRADGPSAVAGGWHAACAAA